MKGTRLAAISLCVWLAGAGAAHAALTPTGNTLWNITAGNFSIAVEVYAGSALGLMTLKNSLNGLSAVGTLYPAAVVDRPHGELDELIIDAFFQQEAIYPVLGLGTLVPGSIPAQGAVHIGLGDIDGLAFDGAAPGFGGQFLLPVNPPSLDLFEQNAVVITHSEIIPPMGIVPIAQTLAVSSLPEPALGALVTPLLALLAARRRARGA